jgi:hypothetical protein
MRAIFFLFLLVLNFGPPFGWGYTKAPFWTAILWAVTMAVGAVGTGWRDRGRGVTRSLIVGTLFASVWCVPAYLIGRWLA